MLRCARSEPDASWPFEPRSPTREAQGETGFRPVCYPEPLRGIEVSVGGAYGLLHDADTSVLSVAIVRLMAARHTAPCRRPRRSRVPRPEPLRRRRIRRPQPPSRPDEPALAVDPSVGRARRYSRSLVARAPALPPPLKSAEPTSRNAGASGFTGIAATQHTAAAARMAKLARSTRLDEPPRRNEPAASEPGERAGRRDAGQGNGEARRHSQNAQGV